MSGQAGMMSLAQDDTEFHVEMARRQLDDLSLEFRTDCAEETRPPVFHGPCVRGSSTPRFTDSIHSTLHPYIHIQWVLESHCFLDSDSSQS